MRVDFVRIFSLLMLLSPMTAGATSLYTCRIEGSVASSGQWDRFRANGTWLNRVMFWIDYHGSSGKDGRHDAWCRNALEGQASMNEGRIQVTINNPLDEFVVPAKGVCMVLEWRLLEAEIVAEGFADLPDSCSRPKGD